MSLTAYGPDPIGLMHVQEDAQMDADDRDYCARADALDDLRRRCSLFDLVFFTTGGRPVPVQPVTHRRP